MTAKDRRLGLTKGQLAELDFWFCLGLWPPSFRQANFLRVTRGKERGKELVRAEDLDG